MSQVLIQGKHPGVASSNIEKAVQKYAAANPQVSVSDAVTVTVKGDDGKPCTVDGAFQRTPAGAILFVLVEIVVNAIRSKLGGDRVSSRDKRKSKRSVRRAVPSGNVPEDAEARYKYFTDLGMLRTEKDGTYRMAGGHTFKTREELMAYLGTSTQEVAKAPATAPTAKATKVKAKPAAKAKATKSRATAKRAARNSNA